MLVTRGRTTKAQGDARWRFRNTELVMQAGEQLTLGDALSFPVCCWCFLSSRHWLSGRLQIRFTSQIGLAVYGQRECDVRHRMRTSTALLCKCCLADIGFGKRDTACPHGRYVRKPSMLSPIPQRTSWQAVLARNPRRILHPRAAHVHPGLPPSALRVAV